MPDIKPFTGLRYVLKTPADLGNYAAPPYDMIDDDLARGLYAKHEYNSVRVIQNLKEPTDTCNKDRHVRAGTFFDAWRKQGLLVHDAEPSVYVYEQKFTIVEAGKPVQYERLGVVSLVKLVPFSDGIVLPHEYTFSGPKADRYELLESIRANTGQIFGIITDKDAAFHAAIKECRAGDPIGTFNDIDGTLHNLYRMTDPAVVARLTSAAKDRTVLIADGHHRYETALNYFKNTGDPAASHVMMTLVSARDPGLVILPFHRMLRRCKHISAFSVDRLSEFFTVKDLGAAALAEVDGFLRGEGDQVLMYVDNQTRKLYALSPNSAGENYLSERAGGKSRLWTHLNVSIINMLVLQGLLDLDITDSVVVHDTLDFSNNSAVALERALSGDTYYGSIFLRPASVGTIAAVVDKNERMPQKSTCFFPKLYSGLVFNVLGHS